MGAYRDNLVNKNPLWHVPLDDSSSSSIQDSVGSNDGNISGNYTLESEEYISLDNNTNKSILFDNAKIDFGNILNSYFGGLFKEFTLLMLFKSNQLTTKQTLLSYDNFEISLDETLSLSYQYEYGSLGGNIISGTTGLWSSLGDDSLGDFLYVYNIDTWYNLEDNTQNGTKHGSPELLQNQVNGLATMKFGQYDGYDLLNSKDIARNVSAFSIYALIKLEGIHYSEADLFEASISSNNNERIALRISFEDTELEAFFRGDNDNSYARVRNWFSSSEKGTYAIIGAEFDYINKKVRAYIDGSFNENDVSDSISANASADSDSNSVGIQRGNKHIEEIGEIIIFKNHIPSQADREELEGQLAHKWGLENKLSSAHPYKSTDPGSLPVFSSGPEFHFDASNLANSFEAIGYSDKSLVDWNYLEFSKKTKYDINTWYNLEDNTKNATKFGNPELLENQVNNLSTIKFDSDDYYELPNSKDIARNVSTFSIYAVVKLEGTGDNWTAVFYTTVSNSTGGRCSLYVDFSNNDIRAFIRDADESSYDYAVYNFSTERGNYAIIASEIDYTNKKARAYLNGLFNEKDVSSDISSSTSADSDSQYVRIHTDNNKYVEQIAEVIVFKDHIPSQANREELEGYLAHKWGLLNKLTPYYYGPTVPDISSHLIYNWGFDNGSGTTIADLENNLSATLTNPTWNTNDLEFNGTDTKFLANISRTDPEYTLAFLLDIDNSNNYNKFAFTLQNSADDIEVLLTNDSKINGQAISFVSIANIITVGPGKDYSTISAAINNANPLDKIEIYPGTYNEQVTLNTPVHLVGMGATPDDTHIYWGDDVIRVYLNSYDGTFDNIYIENLKVSINSSWRGDIVFQEDLPNSNVIVNGCKLVGSGSYYTLKGNNRNINLKVFNSYISRGYAHVFKLHTPSVMEFHKVELNNSYYCYTCNQSLTVDDWVSTSTTGYGPDYYTPTIFSKFELEDGLNLISIVFKSNTFYIYDGINFGQDMDITHTGITPGDLVLGKDLSGNYYKFKIKEFKYYNYAFDDMEIVRLNEVIRNIDIQNPHIASPPSGLPVFSSGPELHFDASDLANSFDQDGGALSIKVNDQNNTEIKLDDDLKNSDSNNLLLGKDSDGQTYYHGVMSQFYLIDGFNKIEYPLYQYSLYFNDIEGNILDDKFKTLDYVYGGYNTLQGEFQVDGVGKRENVYLLDNENNKIINRVTTSDDGSFQFEKINNNCYRILAHDSENNKLSHCSDLVKVIDNNNLTINLTEIKTYDSYYELNFIRNNEDKMIKTFFSGVISGATKINNSLSQVKIYVFIKEYNQNISRYVSDTMGQFYIDNLNPKYNYYILFMDDQEVYTPKVIGPDKLNIENILVNLDNLSSSNSDCIDNSLSRNVSNVYKYSGQVKIFDENFNLIGVNAKIFVYNFSNHDLIAETKTNNDGTYVVYFNHSIEVYIVEIPDNKNIKPMIHYPQLSPIY